LPSLGKENNKVGQIGIPDVLKRVSKNKSIAAHLTDAVIRALEGYHLISKAKAARSSETPHPINSHYPKSHMAFIIRQHCRSQHEI
jgi:hypothetical protein